jgi:hypothetical protein
MVLFYADDTCSCDVDDNDNNNNNNDYVDWNMIHLISIL